MNTYPQVTFLIRKLLTSDASFSKIKPKDINEGNCEHFAKTLEYHFPNGSKHWGNEIPEEFNLDFHEPSHHCFFLYEGEDCQGESRYYDSECSQGVPTPALLPYFKRQVEARKRRKSLTSRTKCNIVST